MSEIANRLPKTVHLDEVTAGDALDVLRMHRDERVRAEDEAAYEYDDTINALANALQNARFEREKRAAEAAIGKAPTHDANTCEDCTADTKCSKAGPEVAGRLDTSREEHRIAAEKAGRTP